MYKTILIATDGSDVSQKAVGRGLALARVLDAKAIVVTVTEGYRTAISGEMVITHPAAEFEKNATEAANTVLARAVEVARKAGIACETLHVKDHYPADGIIDAAKKTGAELIVMASHGRRGISRMLLGSEANKVVTLSTVPVLICR
jgi:nucleotide-binding universal stress UspA family protein